MTKQERLFRIIGLLPNDLVQEADRPVRRRRRRTALAAAACLAAVCALGFGVLGGRRLGSSSGNAFDGGSGAGGSGHDEGAAFMSYAGPVFPLTAPDGGENLTAERTVVLDFAAGTYADGSPRQWGASVRDCYTLTNPTAEDVTVRLLYPFAGSFSELAAELPSVFVNGEEVRAELYAGPYSGGFRDAGGDGSTLNLQNPDSWTQYQALLEDGRYQARALAEYAPLDIPVTVYRFSDFEAPHGQYPAATQAVSFPIDDGVTRILSYGFNGYDRENAAGLRQYSYFVPDGVRHEAETKLLIVLGEDLASYTLQGYRDGGCDRGDEIEGVKCAVAREVSTLEAVLEEVCRDSLEMYGGRELSDAFTPAMHLRAASELLTQYGPLSESTVDRYDTGMLEDVVGEAVTQQRVMYLSFSADIPAGGSLMAEASLWKAPSYDFYCGHTENLGVQGYDLVTRLGSNLTFTRQSAVLENGENVEILRQNFGFDPEGGVTEASLGDGEHYYLELRPREESGE